MDYREARMITINLIRNHKDLTKDEVEALKKAEIILKAKEYKADNFFVESILGTLFYNGLLKEVLGWRNLPETKREQIERPDGIEQGSNLQFMWMICVQMFGEYGTSPRTGWIENVGGFIDFLNELERLAKDWGIIEGVEK